MGIWDAYNSEETQRGVLSKEPDIEIEGDLDKLIKAHSDRLGIDPTVAKENLMKFAEIVGQIENSGKTQGKNPSSAEGLYQFKTDTSEGQSSLETAINRTRKYLGDRSWMQDAERTDAINFLPRDYQTTLFIGDLMEKEGSDKLMRRVATLGDKDAMLEAYLELHHTNRDEPGTLKRAKQFFK